jgi:hypothetical protein
MASSSFLDHHRHRVIKLAELGFRSFPGDSEVRLGRRWVSNQVHAPPTTSPKSGSSRFRFGTDGLRRRCGVDASIPGIHISFAERLVHLFPEYRATFSILRHLRVAKRFRNGRSTERTWCSNRDNSDNRRPRTASPTFRSIVFGGS